MTKVFIDTYAVDFTKDDPDAYMKYQQLLQSMFHYEAERKQPFESSSRAYQLNELIFSSSLTNTYRATLTRSAELARASAWNYVLLLLYREEPVSLKTEHGEFDIEPDQLVFVDLSKPISIYAKSTNLLSLNIPTALLSPLVKIRDDMHGTVLREGPHTQLLLNYIKTLESVAGDIETKDVVSVTDSILRMVANCLNSISDSTGIKTRDAETTNVKVSLLQVKHAIDAQIEDPNLSLNSLMQQFHISRATIYRMFEPLGGVTSYVQNRKLDFAYRELSKHSEKKHNVSKLAYKLGFSHPPAFTRAFKAKFGISPSEVKTTTGKKAKQEIPWYFPIDIEPYKQ